MAFQLLNHSLKTWRFLNQVFPSTVKKAVDKPFYYLKESSIQYPKFQKNILDSKFSTPHFLSKNFYPSVLTDVFSIESGQLLNPLHIGLRKLSTGIVEYKESNQDGLIEFIKILIHNVDTKENMTKYINEREKKLEEQK